MLYLKMIWHVRTYDLHSKFVSNPTTSVSHKVFLHDPHVITNMCVAYPTLDRITSKWWFRKKLRKKLNPNIINFVENLFYKRLLHVKLRQRKKVRWLWSDQVVRGSTMTYHATLIILSMFAWLTLSSSLFIRGKSLRILLTTMIWVQKSLLL